MNWKTTLVLLVLVAGMGAFVYWGDSGKDDGKKSNKLVFPKFKTDDVTKVAIKRGKGLQEEVVLVKDGPVWKLEKPVADKADEGKVRELLAPMELLEWISNKEGDEAKKVAFGDVEEHVELSRSQDKGGDLAFEFGAASLDTRNLRVTGRDHVYTVKKELFDRINWDTFLFRVKELFTLPPGDVSRVSAKTPSLDQGPNAAAKLLELVRGKDRLWRVGGSDGELAEGKKVTEVVDKVATMKAKGVVSDKPADADLATWGIAPSEIEVTLVDSADKSTKTETLQIGKKIDAAKSEERYARLVGRPTVYKIDASDLLKELGKDATAFRTDSLFPLSATTEGVTLVSVKWKGGREWKLVKKDEWSFELPGKAKGDLDAVKAIVKGLADLKISTREASSDTATFGLSEPAFSVTLGEGDALRTLHVGTSAEGGVYFVRRDGESRIYSTKLGDLVAKLENAPLGARAKQLFKASFWEMSSFKVSSPSSKLDLSGEKEGNEWKIPGYKPDEVDTLKLQKAFEPLEALTVDSFVAEVSSASLAQYGLDAPGTLTVNVKSWDASKNEEKKEERVLLLGRREGDSLYALDKGGTAIGKVKPEFLDLLGRGFRKGKQLFDYVNHECFSLVVKDASGNETARLDKKKEGLQEDWYLSSSVAPVTSNQKLTLADVQKLLVVFEKLEGTSVEDATPSSKSGHGLSPAQRTITFQTKPSFGKEEITTKTLLLGSKNGDHDVWVMDQAGTELGSIYEGPFLKLDAFLAAPPVAKEEPKKDGTAPVVSPSQSNK